MERRPVQMARGNARESLTETVMNAVRQQIAARSLVPGARLPSIRAFARTMGVSTFTVTEAYDRLAAEGAIRARPGSGFYVAAPLAPLTLAEIGPRLDREIDPLWIWRQSLEDEETLLKPGCGWLPPDWMPQDAIRRALRGLARDADATLANYSTPLGLPGLRELVARRVGRYGIAASPDQIVLADSGTHAVDLLCRFLIEPGDTVLVDDPCYFNFHALLRAHRARVVGVPFTSTGPDLDAFATAVSAHRPRLYITNSALHNPTGGSISAATAHRLLQLCQGTGMTIIEDDIFADFQDEPTPRLAALDGLERVVQVGSFSKTLSASVRCGYIVARHDWIEALVDLKIATSAGSSHLAAALVLALLKESTYRRHVETLRLRLARKRVETAARLRPLGLEPAIEPRAGMFLWCRLPEGLDAGAIARHALAAGVVLAPGNAFSPARTSGGFLRFNVAQSDDPKICEVLAEAMAATARTIPPAPAPARRHRP
ncbi:MAG: PLP-dependent aminotransferase family protein [Hyphomicrobiales bacterium]